MPETRFGPKIAFTATSASGVPIDTRSVRTQLVPRSGRRLLDAPFDTICAAAFDAAEAVGPDSTTAAHATARTVTKGTTRRTRRD